MAKPLNILIVEDSVDDAELLLSELRRAGFDPRWQRVETEGEFLRELERRPDIILSDYSMPHFSGLRAAELLQARGAATPFILVSGTIGEDVAVAAMKFGATDYLLKDRLGRLGPAVQRALGESAARAERERLKTEAALSDRRLDAFFTRAPAGLALLDGDLRYVRINDTVAEMNGVPAGEHLGKTVREVLPKFAPVVEPILQRVLATGEPVLNMEVSGETPAQPGVIRHWMESFFPILGPDGRPEAVGTIVVEITERKHSEEKLRESERRFRDLLENVELIAMTLDRECRVTFCNDCLLEMTGWQREEVIGADWCDKFLPESCADVKRVFFEDIQAGTVPSHYENSIKTRSGELREIVWNNTLLRDVAGNIVGTASIGEDVTARKQVAAALRAGEERFRQVVENIREVFWMTDRAKQQMIYVSPGYEMIWGRSCESLYQAPASWAEAIHPDDRERVREAAELKQARGDYDEIYRIIRPDGTVRWVHDRAFPVRTAGGGAERIVGTAEDITDRKQLEEQLRQAQKQEAIGQLAGGVAHDFNNILTSIFMQVELAAMDERLSDEVREELRQIRNDAERAASLTRQLLLFSRRQMMQSRNLDLNEVVTTLAKMLQRIIGEDVRLQLLLHPTPLITYADAGMLDQVLMNLAVNARDAMPQGGRLTVETTEKELTEADAAAHSDATAGRHVCLRVIDTGCGIPTDVMPRIFEPFFTTKEPGKGTGLGLATVFGIVKQHHGWIEVKSEPGCGTTFQIWLPAATMPAGPTTTVLEPKPRGGTETILLVEDEAPVRKSTLTLLARNGYRVLEAVNGVDALKVWAANRDGVALLVTDLVMPAGVTGQQLARKLQADKPGLKTLFISGYSPAIAGREIQLRDTESFLQKPFRPDELLKTVRRCLDR